MLDSSLANVNSSAENTEKFANYNMCNQLYSSMYFPITIFITFHAITYILPRRPQEQGSVFHKANASFLLASSKYSDISWALTT